MYIVCSCTTKHSEGDSMTKQHENCFCKLECTQDACSPSTIEPQLSLLKELSRTFSWEFRAPEKIAVGLNILGKGLIETSQPCPNGLQYSVTASKSKSKREIQYCEGGSETRFDLLNQAVMSLKIKPNAPITPVLFQASAGPLRKIFFCSTKVAQVVCL